MQGDVEIRDAAKDKEMATVEMTKESSSKEMLSLIHIQHQIYHLENKQIVFVLQVVSINISSLLSLLLLLLETIIIVVGKYYHCCWKLLLLLFLLLLGNVQLRSFPGDELLLYCYLKHNLRIIQCLLVGCSIFIILFVQRNVLTEAMLIAYLALFPTSNFAYSILCTHRYLFNVK